MAKQPPQQLRIMN